MPSRTVPSKTVPSLEKKTKCPPRPRENEPDAEIPEPDANVAPGGQCVIPVGPESSRPETGDACDDGRGDPAHLR